jgi:hypothetical protein
VKRAAPVLAAILAATAVISLSPGAESGACAQDAVVPRVDCEASAGASGRQTLEQCTAVTQSFRSVSARARGRGLRIAFVRRVNRSVDVDVFQSSAGRRVLGQRRVATFKRRSGAFTWAGRAGSDGIYFVRFRIKDERGRLDEARVALARRSGRFVQLPAFYRRTSCATLTTFKLERPVFGGRGNRALGVSFRVARAGQVRVEIRRNGRVVGRFGPARRAAGATHRLRVASERLARGRYEIRLFYSGDQGSLTASLFAQRL